MLTLRMMNLDFLNQKLIERHLQGNLRQLPVAKDLIDLTSNDYLGFARSQQLSSAILNECQLMSESTFHRQNGSTGSRLLTGNHPYCEQIEDLIAAFHRSESALVFNTGYMANLGLLSSVIKPDDNVLYDAQVHASIHDGLKAAKVRSRPFLHNNVDHLKKMLLKTAKRTFVCIESVYSIDGSIAPVQEIADLCSHHHAYLIVDEAHATGIIGERGEGLVNHLQCESQVFARIHTFSKALGTHGAAVIGSKVLKDYLINFSRPFIYSTALPMHTWASIHCAYKKLPQAAKERSHLWDLKSYFEKSLKALPFECSLLSTPMTAIKISSPKFYARALANAGIDVRAILSPTVRQGDECLRICLHAFNTHKEIDLFLECYANIRKAA